MANNAHYKGITQEVYEKLRNQLSTVGIDMEGKTGKISEKGISANYDYDPEANTLAISNVTVGFPASMMYNANTILEKITETVEGSGGQKIA